MKDNHPIDSLFREGLVSQKMTPTANAWSAIEANVQKKSTKRGFIFYLAIAASVSLVCAFTWTSLTTQQTTSAIQIAEVAKNQPEFNVDPVNKPGVLHAQVTGISKTTQPAPLSNIDDSIENNRQVVFVAALDKRPLDLLMTDARIPLSSDLRFDLPTYTDVVPASSGLKFSFIKSLASVARGVNDGKKAFNSMRKSKIDFINEELNFDKSEEVSKSEATIEQDSPSKEK